jgi:FxLD family lantipeptide
VITVSIATQSNVGHPSGVAAVDALAEFELDVQVTTDMAAGTVVRGCDTSDGCGSTCGSACVSS